MFDQRLTHAACGWIIVWRSVVSLGSTPVIAYRLLTFWFTTNGQPPQSTWAQKNTGNFGCSTAVQRTFLCLLSTQSVHSDAEYSSIYSAELLMSNFEHSPWEFSATLSIPEFTPQFTCTSAIFDKQRFFDRTITCVQPNCSPMLSPCTLSAVSVYPYQSASPIVIGPNLFRPDSVCLGITFVFVISQVLKKVFSLAL